MPPYAFAQIWSPIISHRHLQVEQSVSFKYLNLLSPFTSITNGILKFFTDTKPTMPQKLKAPISRETQLYFDVTVTILTVHCLIIKMTRFPLILLVEIVKVAQSGKCHVSLCFTSLVE